MEKLEVKKVEVYLILVQGFKALGQFLNLFQFTRIISMSCAQILKNLHESVHVEMSDAVCLKFYHFLFSKILYSSKAIHCPRGRGYALKHCSKKV